MPASESNDAIQLWAGQITSYSVVADVKNRVYYLRTYDNYDIRKIDLSKIDFSDVDAESVSIFGKADYRDFKFE